jgi:BASS family bile acid:Na+ symporter
MIERITSLFPLWAILFSFFAYLHPQAFIELKPAIVYLLGVVMFGMGVTLTGDDFYRVLTRPGVIFTGVLLQYLLMPLFAWLLSLALGLAPALMVGMILVGASPGGTASNVICYLARGDVALSITLTTCSTLLAVAATPLLTWFYIGQTVEVPVIKMLVDVSQIVVAPVIAGLLVNSLLGTRIESIKSIFPLLSVVAIVIIIAIIVALNQSRLHALATTLFLAVTLHNVLGLAGGYWLLRCLGYERRTCRTLAIEIGMQNSGLAVALAIKFFSPLAALPGALFSIWHNLSGAVLSTWWSRRHTVR